MGVILKGYRTGFIRSLVAGRLADVSKASANFSRGRSLPESETPRSPTNSEFAGYRFLRV